MGGGSGEVGQATAGQQESPCGCVCGYTGVRACVTLLNTLKRSGCPHEAAQRLGASKQKMGGQPLRLSQAWWWRLARPTWEH